MKTKILNIIAVITVVYSAVSVGYTTLPAEFKEMLPYVNDAVAWVTGGSSGIVGATLLYVDSKIKKSTSSNQEVTALAINKIIEVVKETKGVATDMEANYNELKNLTNQVIQENTELKKLITADLEAKVNNDMLVEKSREIINKALGD